LSDILSQSEIDKLLQALNAGEVNVNEIKVEKNEKKIKKYDFRRPDKFAKDQLRTLQIIHENFSRLLNTFLSGYLRSYTSIEVISVEQLTYHEFGNSISNPAVLGIINFSPLNGQIMVDISTDVAFAIIDRLLGGQGLMPKETRTFTEIELSIMKNLFIKISRLFIEPWDTIIELNPSFEKIETNSQFVQFISPNETIALITMNIKIGEVEGFLNICIPHFVIEPLLTKLSTRYWFSNEKMEPNITEKEAIGTGLKKTTIEIRAIIGSNELTVGEFLNLQVGDVITLNNKVDGDMKIYLEDKLKFLGKPGVINNKMAVKITQLIEEGDDIVE